MRQRFIFVRGFLRGERVNRALVLSVLAIDSAQAQVHPVLGAICRANLPGSQPLLGHHFADLPPKNFRKGAGMNRQTN